jgi:DNA-binding MarR family transcriptional regulator
VEDRGRIFDWQRVIHDAFKNRQKGVCPNLLCLEKAGLGKRTVQLRLSLANGSRKKTSKNIVDTLTSVVHTHTVTNGLDMSAVENCVCFNLRRVTRAVTQSYDSEMRRHGIRPTQGTILLALNAKESWTMAELSDCLGLERTSLVRNLQPLQRDGLVTADGGGRGRRVEPAITAKGRKQVEKFMPAWQAAQSAVVKTLGEKRWSTILSDLETAALALNK